MLDTKQYEILKQGIINDPKCAKTAQEIIEIICDNDLDNYQDVLSDIFDYAAQTIHLMRFRQLERGR